MMAQSSIGEKPDDNSNIKVCFFLTECFYFFLMHIKTPISTSPCIPSKKDESVTASFTFQHDDSVLVFVYSFAKHKINEQSDRTTTHTHTTKQQKKKHIYYDKRGAADVMENVTEGRNTFRCQIKVLKASSHPDEFSAVYFVKRLDFNLFVFLVTDSC